MKPATTRATGETSGPRSETAPRQDECDPGFWWGRAEATNAVARRFVGPAVVRAMPEGRRDAPPRPKRQLRGSKRASHHALPVDEEDGSVVAQSDTAETGSSGGCRRCFGMCAMLMIAFGAWSMAADYVIEYDPSEAASIRVVSPDETPRAAAAPSSVLREADMRLSPPPPTRQGRLPRFVSRDLARDPDELRRTAVGGSSGTQRSVPSVSSTASIRAADAPEVTRTATTSTPAPSSAVPSPLSTPGSKTTHGVSQRVADLSSAAFSAAYAAAARTAHTKHASPSPPPPPPPVPSASPLQPNRPHPSPPLPSPPPPLIGAASLLAPPPATPPTPLSISPAPPASLGSLCLHDLAASGVSDRDEGSYGTSDPVLWIYEGQAAASGAVTESSNRKQ